MSFELELARRTNCSIAAFDPTVAALPGEASKTRSGDPPYQPCGRGNGGGRLRFWRRGLGASAAGQQLDGYPLHTLDTLARMAGVGDGRIDVLKIDCEGCEWSVFEQLAAGTLLRVDQLLIELHFFQPTSNRRGNRSGVVRLCRGGARVLGVGGGSGGSLPLSCCAHLLRAAQAEVLALFCACETAGLLPFSWEVPHALTVPTVTACRSAV